jgi:alcohol dehydrogenase, propanol-preferring
MHAMVLKAPHEALEFLSVGDPLPAPEQLVVKVDACGVCRTDLHIIDGELPHARSPFDGHAVSKFGAY